MALEDPHEMVRLTASPPDQALFSLKVLQGEGIRCHVRRDYKDFGVGDTSGFSAEIWVEVAKFSRAEAILGYQASHPEHARPDEPVGAGRPPERARPDGPVWSRNSRPSTVPPAVSNGAATPPSSPAWRAASGPSVT